jgi:hypothetical protein
MRGDPEEKQDESGHYWVLLVIAVVMHAGSFDCPRGRTTSRWAESLLRVAVTFDQRKAPQKIVATEPKEFPSCYAKFYRRKLTTSQGGKCLRNDLQVQF